MAFTILRTVADVKGKSVSLVPVNADLALQDAASRARDYLAASKAPATIRAYRSDWAHFAAWCARTGLVSMPASPETVAVYLSALAEHAKTATLQRRLSSISQAHQAAGHDNPCGHLLVRATWAGIRRTLGTAQQGKRPVVTAQLRAMVGALPPGTLGARDRLVLLLGFAGAFRRSELVALDLDDVQEAPEGLVVTIRRSKTDQEGEGRKLGVPFGAHPETCPVRAWRAWVKNLDSVEIADCAVRSAQCALFRSVDRHGNIGPRLSDRAVALIVKRAAERIGLDPAAFAGHSLRSGLATSAAAAGVEERVIAEQTGHKSMTVLRRYIRTGSVFLNNAAGQVGL